MKLLNHRTYTLTTGALLFALGFFGFAFRSSFNVPDKYLVASLILGFWGVVAGAGRGHQQDMNNKL